MNKNGVDDRRFCSLALWLYYLGFGCLTWVTGFLAIVMVSALWRGSLTGSAFVVVAWVLAVLPGWREVIDLRRHLFQQGPIA